MNKREIARLLNLSRQSVRKVLRSNSTAVPEIQRAEKAEPYRQQILELLHTCKGNLVRVHEELVAEWRGAVVSGADRVLPPARHRTSARRSRPAGIISSPASRCSMTPRRTKSNVAGTKCKAQTASAVLCYSRMLFFQIYPTFQRFDCKVFLTDALRYMGGAPRTRDDR